MLPMRTIPQLLLERASAAPDRLVERHKYRGIWREYTYGDVLEKVRSFALGLDAIGIRRGETVAIVGENEPENFWSEFAAFSIGCKIVSLYPDITADEIEYLLNDSDAVCLVAQDQEQVDKGFAILDRVRHLRQMIYWDDTGMWSYRHERLTPFEKVVEVGRARHAEDTDLFRRLVETGRPDDVAVLSYTSGTTGRPKGVVLTHRYLVDNAHRVIAATGIKPGMKRFGTTQRQLAAVAAKNHRHSVENPLAQFRNAYSVDEVLNAPPITYPLTLPMCSPISDGAAAAILATEAGLKRLGLDKSRAIRVLASVIQTGSDRDPSEVERHCTALAAKKAYNKAGIGPDDVAVAEVHVQRCRRPGRSFRNSR